VTTLAREIGGQQARLQAEAGEGRGELRGVNINETTQGGRGSCPLVPGTIPSRAHVLSVGYLEMQLIVVFEDMTGTAYYASAV
jgi:hypothetical protein